ncbi:Serrate RNA effector molecule like [Actinidia chinensis var. chinensis]|uniref:Serrate RNA effector molecule like n=1 Tax=Actinidia chinensis var. chinensis TaxID=1590841 RepID=A0A2R6S061_ACTCC|nr:Serrate RNA effector molecule like [Actinidia chinensis var. chinensis]
MSRCFPFPPPGYEKKARTDDIDLLKKEKHREKKYKKEKKDKEKRERKEKREKDRSDGKHKDKKGRKEKHRDKRKEKERDKDKDKSSTTTEETKIAGQSEIYKGQKLNQQERELDKCESSTSNEKKQCHDDEKPIQNSLLSEGVGDSKFVQELGRRIRSEEKVYGSQLAESLPGTEPKNAERMDRLVVKDNGFLDKGKENNKGKRVDDRTIDGQGIRGDTRTSSSAVLPNLAGLVQNRVEGIRGDTRPSGSAVVPNLAGLVQNRVEGMSRPSEKSTERRVEEKEKCKEREGDKKRVDKQKDKGSEKKGHRKDKDREKETKKEKVKEKSEHKNKDQDKSKDRNKNDLLDTLDVRNSHASKDGDRNFATEGNLKKRKHFETNGFLHENDIRPSKMPRPSPHPSTENGRKLEPCQTLILSASGRPGPPNNLKVDNKERKVNGVIEPQSLSSSSKKSSAITQADQIAQASIKPPHPDSKYLSQVLSVPKMEEWFDFDDQEWLFSSKDRSSEKPNVASTNVTGMPMVWAEALQIESADVCALPYVIPY